MESIARQGGGREYHHRYLLHHECRGQRDMAVHCRWCRQDAILAKLKENYPDVEEAMLVADLDEQIQYWVSENLIV